MKTLPLIGAVLCALPFYAGADTVRPAVGKPLLQAEALMQKRDYPAALAKVQQASEVAAPTPYERLVIAQMRGAAAAGDGDYDEAAAAYQDVLASGAETGAERTALTQAIGTFYYQAHDYPHAIIWLNRYIAAGGSAAGTGALLSQAYYQSADYRDAERTAWREVGTAPSAPELQLLASSAKKAGDQNGYRAALELLLKNDPTPAYWADAIALVTASPDFSDQLTLDVYRLRRATDTLTAAADYEDYAERAILAGQAREAKLVIDTGFSTGVLNATTDAGHAARLQTLADQAAPATAAPQPRPSNPLDAGVAAFTAGRPLQAVLQFQSVPHYADPNSDAAAELARLWAIRAGAAGDGT